MLTRIFPMNSIRTIGEELNEKRRQLSAHALMVVGIQISNFFKGVKGNKHTGLIRC